LEASIPRKVKRIDVSSRRIRQLERALDRLVERRAPEDVLRQRAEIVLAQIASVSAAVLIANDHARYIDLNAACALTGYTRPELLRMNLWDLTPERSSRVGQKLWRAFRQRGRMRGSYHLRRKDGSMVRVRYVAVADVLPGIHVSAMTTPALTRARTRGPRKRRTRHRRRR
jgi:PAS domain S-box-containing protein